MFRQVRIDPLQKVTSQNFMDFGNFPKFTLDTVLSDLFGPGQYFSGFACTNAGSGQLRVGAGRFYKSGVGYYNDADGGETLDLLARAPVVNSVWIAIVVSADLQTEADVKATTFLADSTDRTISSRFAPQEIRRWAKVSPIVGTVSTDPQYPPIPSDVVAVAFVLMGPSNILRIVPNEASRSPTIQGLARRLDENDVWRQETGTQIEALGSNMAAIAQRQKDSASKTFVTLMARDIANLKRLQGLPDTYSAYDFEAYLDQSKSDVNNVDYLCEIEEGVRFGKGTIQIAQLQMANPYDANVAKYGDLCFAAFDHEVRVSNIARDRTNAISQYTSASYEMVQKTMVRERLRVGSWFESCTNWFYYAFANFGAGGSYDALSHIFTLANGEMFEVAPESADQVLADAKAVAAGRDSSHLPLRLRQVWSDGLETVAYTDTIVNRSTAIGVMTGQTFLCPQDGWWTNVNVIMQAVGATGDIQFYAIEVPANGQPDISKVVGRGVLQRKDMAPEVTLGMYWEYPVAVRKGYRYGFVMVTQGAHVLYMTKDNKLSNGSSFYVTDGAWAMGDPTLDYAFELSFAKFRTNRFEMQLQPLTLPGGIANVDIVATRYIPDGTALTYYVQVNGVWKQLNNIKEATNLFNGLPGLINMKVVFQGTFDNMPAQGVLSQSKATTHRPRSTFKHISTERIQPTGQPAKTIVIQTRLEAWRGAPYHTHNVKLRTGAGFTTITNPSMVEDEVAPDDPKALIRTSTFVLGSAVSSFKIEQNGTTDNVLTCFHVALRNDVETTT